MVKDVEEISKAFSPDDKRNIAATVKQALDKKRDWCNWVVLVSNTDEDSNYFLHSMTKIPVGKVTVAVDHTMKIDKEDEKKLSKQLNRALMERIANVYLWMEISAHITGLMTR